MEQEYIVTLKKGVDYDGFWSEVEGSTEGLEFIPDRDVKIVNERLGSLRSCHYALEDQEAEKLKNDPRVLDVELNPMYRDDIEFKHHVKQTANFTKSTNSAGPYINWGLLRGAFPTNIYGLGSTATDYTYDYHLDGTGVDVVISDSGLQVDHPEFQDANGVSRVQQIDWYLEAGYFEPGPVDLKTKSTVVVSSNSFISFNRATNSYSNFAPVNIGAALKLGATDASVDSIYAGSENSGRSYRMRFIGNSIYSQVNAGSLKWEVRFLDNNWIEILMIRHDSATITDWGFQNDSSIQIALASYFAKSSLSGAGAAPLSCVLTSNDGQTWMFNDGDTSQNYHAELINGLWTLVAGTATEKGQGTLSAITTTHADDLLYRFNTPFDFYTFYQSQSSQSGNHYRDWDGHGTHVAGIAAGKNYGWAKGARIYSLKVDDLTGTGDLGNGIPITDSQDLITAWHLRKPVDPTTGLRRPTVVNMSWGSSGSYTSVTSGNYRGSAWSSTDSTANDATKRLNNFGLQSTAYRIPARQSWLDADIDQMLDVGIVVCIAAGNVPYKHDIIFGADYDNFAVTNAGTKYYHRGSSPHSENPGCFKVGCTDITVTDPSYERSTYFSTRGIAVNIWAPGTNIMSATSNTNVHNGQPYYFNGSFKQTNISGTSMASPQVAGIVALMLQINPGLTLTEIWDLMFKSSKPTLDGTGTDTDYGSTYAILGSSNRMAYMPYAVDIGMKNTARTSANLKR